MDALDLLLTRDSAVRLVAPAPSQEELETIIKCALRAPDHGRRRPWRFVAITGDKLERYGEVMAEFMRLRKPDSTPEALERERRIKSTRAPLVVVVAARTKQNDNIPEVEQLLSAGAATQNVMLAAHALGYGAMWRTGPPAYEPQVKQALGLEPTDSITGLIYIGTRAGGPSVDGLAEKQEPAPRPVPADFVTVWQG